MSLVILILLLHARITDTAWIPFRQTKNCKIQVSAKNPRHKSTFFLTPQGNRFYSLACALYSLQYKFGIKIIAFANFGIISYYQDGLDALARVQSRSLEGGIYSKVNEIQVTNNMSIQSLIFHRPVQSLRRLIFYKDVFHSRQGISKNFLKSSRIFRVKQRRVDEQPCKLYLLILI